MMKKGILLLVVLGLLVVTGEVRAQVGEDMLVATMSSEPSEASMSAEEATAAAVQ